MTNAKEDHFPLKVMMNKHTNEVLFAEADSDFTDILLSFLTLPLGTIVRVLNEHFEDEAPVFGSITTLYNSLSNLDSDNFWSEGGKQMLLNPRSSFQDECRKLKLNVDDTEPTKYFRCANRVCNKISPLISMYHGNVKCDCGRSLSKAMGMMESKSGQDDIDGDGGVFTKKGVTFLITNDLKIAPVVPGSIIQTLVNLGITVMSGAELRSFTLGFNDIIHLLRASLLSSTPLTDLVFPERWGNHYYCYLIYNLPLRKNEESPSDSKKMTVKAILRKSDSELLFAQAEDDFVDFLFSLLVIPLGGVGCLLGSNTSLTNIDNLYESISNLVDDKYLRSTPGLKDRLIKPELPPNYLSKNHIFPLSEQKNPVMYFFESVQVSTDYTLERGFWMKFKDPKGEGSYVKRPGKFMVSGELNVERIDSVTSVLDSMKISLSDVEEVELHIGLEEALNILKASLLSKFALSDGLRNLISQKLQEQKQ